MKFTTRQLVTMAVFGALWGVVEISLGSVLHAIKVPLTGLTLTVIGLLVALIGRLFVPKRGSTFFIGVIAMVLKLFSIGNIIIGPMIGILAEALVAELILDIFPQPSRLSFILAIAGGALWTLIQPFFTGLLIFGRTLLPIWLDMIDQGSRLFGLGSQAAIWIAIALVLLYLAVGAIGGWLAWNLGQLVSVRLRGNSPSTVKS
jgi:ABC-type thiamin/hydroxymethylpyrimidine transport system permease subunit